MPASIHPARLRCNHLADPVGLGDAQPEFAWQLAFSGKPGNHAQSAWQVHAASSPAALARGKPDLWDSGQVRSNATFGIAWGGAPLASRTRVHWRVRVWDERNQPSRWSEPAVLETGLLAPGDWSARWIQAATVGGPRASAPAPLLRRDFELPAAPVRARLHITALGLAEPWINGTRVAADALFPGWTDYRTRVQVRTLDVTAALRAGPNTLGAVLGDGWYCGHVEWRDRQLYGDRPRLLAQLEADLPDGTRVTVASDDGWTWRTGPILAADLIMGETHDARLDLGAWCTPDAARAGWAPVEMFEDPGIARDPFAGPTVVENEIVPAVAINIVHEWPRPKYVVDFGQNLVGVVRLRVEAPAGTTLTLRHAEVLDANGQIYTANLRSARATDHYTCRGGGVETWQPRFTFHGFRYVEIKGLPAEPKPADVVAVVLHSVLPPTGEFSCDVPLLNQLQHNIVWGQKGNFLDIPTDCPQRDERLGWTGDAQVFARTAAFNRDVAAFFARWQQDIADSQSPAGRVPATVPHTGLPFEDHDGGPAWADAAYICPWTVYLVYGDTRLLARHYASLRRFVAANDAKSLRDIRVHPDMGAWGGFGDWLALDGSGKVDGGTPRDLIGTAFLAHAHEILARIARLLGHTADAAHHEARREAVRTAFISRYVTAQGLVAGNTQTSYVLALHFGLAPEELRGELVKALVRDIESRGNKLATGFVGTSYLPWVLSENGRADVAFRLLHQTQWPSWLYAVTQGATTIWERWDGWTKEKGFQDAGMNSFNHYAYGAIGDWLYRRVAGLDMDPEVPAYGRLRIRPLPGGEVRRAAAALETVRGRAAVSWELRDGTLAVRALVPPNTTAQIELPAPEGSRVRAGKSARPVRHADGVAVLEAGAGEHTLEVLPPPAPKPAKARR